MTVNVERLLGPRNWIEPGYGSMRGCRWNEESVFSTCHLKENEA